ncbi:cation-translocating P-type ATPase [Fulvivirga sp. 29W222]|uniref:Cation-translocating P-type ATPase n=1 Tax=Fulvivirga marina TaxID=2494733 RepID=A0A937FZ12_9BACT|nr:cation-translocating P-type ATPase [Fulvivirga marina]MBL6448779.1 cation-translocating P-type ATPase [Fulvivirga marina]
MKSAYNLKPEQIFSAMGITPESGLNDEGVTERREQYGVNDIQEDKGQTWADIILRQVKSPIVLLLFFAAGASFFFGEWLDGIAILIVILINTAVGFYMEYQADRSMQALRDLTSITARGIRNGILMEIDSRELVPGDIIYLEAGDMVPADARIFKLALLQINESTLTGESLPVEKGIDALPEGTAVAEQVNMVFKGTYVTRGNASAIVTGTGMDTELGKIANLVSKAEQASTPLEKKLEAFSKRLIKVTLLLVLLIFIAGWLMGQDFFEMLRTSIALAVAAIPEGLPIVATLGLARGMLIMARHNVIVKKLSAVETLGSTNVICTDKTGTLTENQMSVQRVKPKPSEADPANSKILQAMALCNTANITDDGTEIGDPLETALLRYVNTYGVSDSIRSRYPKISEEPFSSETKRMITTHKDDDGSIAFVKGAVEEILLISDKIGTENTVLTSENKKALLNEASELASSGYKVIALAFQQSPSNKIRTAGFSFLAIVALMDPARPDVAQAIDECKSAGIKVIMITGDHPQTANEIATQLNLIDRKNKGTSTGLMGSEMKAYEELTEDDKTLWTETSVFARVNPVQKLDLIQVLQDQKYVVGMTGDGVNDAPALKKADIGIAMGQRGTQVAQGVADMILKDDSFSSIVMAIKQGRIIFENIRKFVIYLLSSNLSEIIAISIASGLSLHFQLLPLQILFINLVSDVLPALALGATAAPGDIMKQPPRNQDKPIIDPGRWRAIIFYAITISACSLGAVVSYHFLIYPAGEWNPELYNNILFFTLISAQLLHVFNMNSSSSNFFRSEVMRNKYVWYALACGVGIIGILYQFEIFREVLSLYPLTVVDWLVIVTFSLLNMTINYLAKFFKIIAH